MKIELPRRVGGDWLHWRIGWRCHFGLHRHGNWGPFTVYTRRLPGLPDTTWVGWWRFFLAITRN